VARLILSGTLKQLSGGVAELELDARDVRQLIRQLGERIPALAQHLQEEGYAVAIDGEIFPDPWLQPVGPQSEVHLVPPIGGG
jgi:sulfur-carrier protein